MKKLIFTLFLALIMCDIMMAQSYNAIETELQNVMDQKNDEMISVNIVFKSQISSKELESKTRRTSDKSLQREIVIAELKDFSLRKQADIMSILQAEEISGTVKDINCLWIANAINCKATPDVIYKLSSHPDILSIGYDKVVQIIDDNKEIKVKDAPATRGSAAPHVLQVRANQVWNQGYTGKNVIVAVLDSGTNIDHYDLKDHLWVGEVDGEMVHGWNYISNNSDIRDDYGHGTHCAGIVCGDGTVGNTVGVAPDATLMTLKVVNRAGGGSPSAMMSGVQFAIEHGAQILSASLGFKISQIGVAASESLRTTFVNALNSGVIVCAAAGNDGNTYGAPDNVDVPGSCPPPYLHDDQTLKGGVSSVVCVGSVNSYNNHVSTSSEGPSTWNRSGSSAYTDYIYSGTSMGLIRPDISAPGELVYSLKYDEVDKYKYMSGTSQATPCVAGVMALMLEKNPNLTPAQICQIIEETASNKPTTKNNYIGSGVIDALNAVDEVSEGVQKPFITLTSVAPTSVASGNDKNIRLSFKNTGKSASENTTATLSTEDSYVTIVTPTQTLGTIGANGTVDNVMFTINVSDDVPNGHTVSFDLLMSNGNLNWTSKFSIKTDSYAKIVYQSSSIGTIEATGNDTGISVKMINKGTAATTENTDVILSTKSPYVTIVDNNTTLGAMNVGEEKDATFTINVSPTTPDNATVTFNLQSTPNNGLVTKNITYEFEAELDEFGYPTDGFNGWTTFDNSADGRNHPFWHSQDATTHKVAEMGSTHSGAGQLLSEAYCQASMQEYTLPIDNFLVSPKVKASASSKMSFYARAHASYPGERFKVVVSEASNNIASDFTQIASYTISGTGYSEWKKYEVDLSAYAGKEIYVAIRHTFTNVQWVNASNGLDVYMLHVDDVTFHNVIEASDEFKYNNSSDFSVIIKSNPLPAPQKVTATTNGTSGSTSVNVAWDYVTNAQSYNIYRNGSYIRNVGGTNLSYADNGLNPNTEYCYEVAAVYNNTEYAHSESACVTTDRVDFSTNIKKISTDKVYPGSNTISITLVNDGLKEHGSRTTVTLSTADNYVDATSISPATGASMSALAVDAEKTIDFTFTLKNDTPHNHVLNLNVNVAGSKVYDGTSWDNVCNWNLSFTLTAISQMETPSNVNAKVIDANTIILDWDMAYKATSYNVYRNGTLVANVTDNRYSDNNLTHNTEYNYTVTSVSGTEESAHSDVVTAITPQEARYIVCTSVDVTSLNVGKENTIVATLKNEGTETVNDITAVLSCDNNNVNIVSNNIYVSEMAAGETAEVTFVVTTTGNISENETIYFDVTANYYTETIGNIKYTFDTDLESWTPYNRDTDEYNWEYDSDRQCAKSYSYYKKNLSPDNILISPKKITVSSNSEIKYRVGSTYTGTGSYYKEKYRIFVTEIGPDPTYGWDYVSDQSVVYEETLSAKGWKDASASLSSKANKSIWIVFEHYDCRGQDALLIDDVEITNVLTAGNASNISSFSLTAVASAPNTFVVDGLWSNPSNWSEGVVPASGDMVVIEAKARIDSDVTASSITISRGGASLTINGGVSLTAEKIANNNADAFVIKDGAELYTNNNVAATLELGIINPTEWSENNKEGWQFIASPFINAKVSDYTEIDTYDLYRYDGAKDYEWINHKDQSNDFDTTFQQGVAYLASYQNEDYAYLRGDVNIGKSFTKMLSYNETKDLANFHLIGNPFPFNMDWTDVKTYGLATGYAVVNNEGGYDYRTSGTIKVGEGFFVKAQNATATFSYGARGDKNAKETNTINVIATGNAGNDNVVVNLSGKSEGFPKLNNFNENIANIYVLENEKRYGIYNCNADIQEVKLFFEVKEIGNYTISIEPEGNYEYIVLIDRNTGIETNMLLENYEFTATSDDSNDRFVLRFSKCSTNEYQGNFAYQSGDELVIEAKGSIEICDVVGRMVYRNEVKNNHRINVSNFNKATYIVRCINGDDVKTQKVVIL